MTFSLISLLLVVVISSIAMSTIKKGTSQQKYNIISIVGFIVALILNVMPPLRYGMQEWTWSTTVVTLVVSIHIIKVLYGWKQNK